MSRRQSIVLLWLACLLVAGGWIWRSIEVDHDLAAFFPDRGRPIETLLMSRANSGAVSRLVLIAFEGGELNQRLAASREAASALRAIPGIEDVANGERRPDADAFTLLFPYRYLLDRSSQLDAAGLRTALETRVKELRSPLGVLAKQHLDSDPTARFRKLLRRWGDGSTAPDRESGVWVSPDRLSALLIARLTETGGHIGPEAGTVTAIRKTLNAIADNLGVELRLAGQPILASDARISISSSLVSGGLTASLLLIALLLWMYRSFGVLVLGMLPLASGALVGLAAVLLLFGGVHSIALAFGVTLLGITIDYPLHLFSHHREGDRLTKTARNIERPLFLGALTTAGAFTIFGAGSTPGLDQLAVYASIGILVAALTLRYVVPVMAELAGIEPRLRPFDLLPAIAPRPLALAVILVALAAAVTLSSRHLSLFESDINALNPLPDAAKALDRRLRADLGAAGPRHLLLISADDAETVLQHAETLTPLLNDLETNGDITGYDTPSRYLPSQARQTGHQAGLPSTSELAATLAAATEGLPFNSGLFEPFRQAVEDSRQLAPLTAEAGLALFAGTPLGIKLDQLLLQADDRWYGFLPLRQVGDVAGLQAIAEATAEIELIDLKALTDDILLSFRNEALVLMMLGLIAALILLGVLGYPLTGLARSALVLTLSLPVTAAILALAGEQLTMLHILAALLVIGLGIDYTVFFSWPSTDDEQRRRMRQALIACMLSTTLVFGLLAGSSIGVLSAIGLTVAIGAFTTFAFTYAILSRQHG
ncbi:MAG: MMPL family transporter [Geminicoccaceae bacterium]